MSGLPPLNAEPGTPAHEWAAKTTSALDPDPGTPTANTINPTTRQLFEEKNLRPGTTASDTLGNPPPPAPETPGREVPGAYPNEAELQPRGQEINQTMSQTASKAAGTASDLAHSAQQAAATYIPMAAQTVGSYLPKSVVDTFSTYVPGVSNPQGEVRASEHDKVHATSLPSTELAGQYAGEQTDGAGALPGALTENEVTKLPDERNTSIPTAGTMAATAAGTAAVATGTAAGYTYAAANSAKDTVAGTAQTAKERVTQEAPVSGLSTTKYSLPSEEQTGAKPFEHTDGVGALPGQKTESGVASLPEERFGTGSGGVGIGAASLPTNEIQGAQPHEHSGGAGALPGNSTEPAVAVVPDEKHGGDFKETAELAGAGAAAAGMGKWALDDRSQQQQSKVGEDMHLADSAKSAGAESAGGATQPQQPMKETPKEAPKEELKKEESKEKKLPHGKGNQGKPRQPGAHVTFEDARHGDGSVERRREGEEGHEKQANPLKPNLAPRAHVLGSPGAKWAGVDVGTDGYRHGDNVDLKDGGAYDSDYHPSNLHPAEGDYAKERAEMNKESAKDDGPVTGEKHSDSKEPASTGAAPATAGRDEAAREDKDKDKDAQPDKVKKAGFMAKMKGEAKVLLGKVEGKKDKVEEGQRMKAGETAH